MIKSGVALPDVEYAWDYFYGVGRSGRGRLDAHEGLQSFHGSVPNILVLFNGSRGILEMALGVLSKDSEKTEAANANITYAATTVTHVGEDFTSGTNFKDGTYAIFAGNTIGYISTTVGGGVTELTVYPTAARTGTAGWNGPIPVSGGSGDGYEIRATESVGSAAGDKFIVQAERLSTMTWAVQHRGSRGQATWVVNYLGGKVNRATLSARQGQKLQLSLDDVIFRDLRHDVALPSSSVAKYSGSVITPSPTHPTEEPLVFSQGTLSLFEVTNTFARIVSFSLSIDHQLTEQQYISTVSVGGGTVVSQVPYEMTEGIRMITIEIEALLDTREFWEHLMRQGQNDALNAKTGFDLMLQFQNVAGTENLYLQTPAALDTVLVAGVTGAADLASATNIGALIESAPHAIPAETESVIPVRMRLSLPSVVLRFDDV